MPAKSIENRIVKNVIINDTAKHKLIPQHFLKNLSSNVLDNVLLLENLISQINYSGVNRFEW